MSLSNNPEVLREMREHRLEVIDTYLGKRDLSREWELPEAVEVAEVEDEYVRGLRTRVKRLQVRLFNMGINAESL